MTVGKASALAAGFVGAVALGVAIGPTVHDKWAKMTSTPSASQLPKARQRTARQHAAARPHRARGDPQARRQRHGLSRFVRQCRVRPDRCGASRSRCGSPNCATASRRSSIQGTKIELAAEDFETPEQFVTVAHAARNTSVPFMVLKHRVLNEGQTLAEAIHEFKPESRRQGRSRRAHAPRRRPIWGISRTAVPN